jgi:cell division septal protein FtsQ
MQKNYWLDKVNRGKRNKNKMKHQKNFKKRYRIKKKKFLLENNIFGGFFIFFVLLFSSIYFFVFFSYFQIKKIEIENAENINLEKVGDIAKKDISKIFLFFNVKSTFLISPSEIKEDILKEIKTIKNVVIRRVFPANLKIIIEERVPAAIFCKEEETENCFYLDKEGVVFQRVDSYAKDFPIIISNVDFVEGDNVIAKGNINTIFYLKEEFLKIKTDIVYFEIFPQKTIEAVSDKGWRVQFSLENTKKEMSDLKIIMEKIPKEEWENLNYIDLRFGDRIYYK